jgi:DNA modification methylase/superfamily II DNA or RNA helicase
MTIQNNYYDFLDRKNLIYKNEGLEVDRGDIHPLLFDFQADLTRFALRKGRAALFADTGLGKTFMQLEWARLTGEKSLIIAPLSVARQTVNEAKKLGIQVTYARSQSEVTGDMTITNYEMVEHFNPQEFGAVVLDESSILKALDGKTRSKLTSLFGDTRFKLCCTATPAPNDIAEIANHAEFLGIITRAEMLATFFVHDDEGWRLKGHAEQDFYKWLASWGMSIRKPSDLGYSDDGYILPPLEVKPLFIDTDYTPEGMLFFDKLKGVQDRSAVRKATMVERVQAAVDMVNADDEQWIVWCGLNDEGRLLADSINGSVSVEGNDSPEHKASALEAFQDGTYRVLVTKPRIAGFGMNFQNAHKMAFVGLSDSFEAYYQCIRRCWRFGQKQPVTAYIVLSDAERTIWDNVTHKEREAKEMSEKLIEHVKEFEKAEIGCATASNYTYETDTTEGNGYKLMLGDSAERMAEIPDGSIDLSVFSPPFMSLYTYSPTERDLGNSRSEDEFFGHFNFIIDQLLRVTKPGRACCVHVAQVPAMLARDGYIGLKDFRGKTIERFEDRGWIYDGEVCIDKDPQAQAIRTKAKALLFVQMRKDSSWSRPALADYIIKFRKPGENKTPITPEITNDQWIEWARPIWYGIKETETLNVVEAREEKDERHICPLQLETIERCIKLWSNPGELICSPFAGIGSEGYVALKQGRRFVGCELKRSYYETAARNLERAVTPDEQHQLEFFAEVAG